MEVFIKTRSTPVSLSFKGQTARHTTIKWSIVNILALCTQDVTLLCNVKTLYVFLFDREYYLQRIINIEQNPDPKKGNRFLLELQLGVNGSDLSLRLSEYVYVPIKEQEVCFPQGMQWENNATVYFILPVKNQGKWVHHFASQLRNMSSKTGDLNFHVIIIDFESQDVDMEKLFDVWPLKERHTLIKMTGPFYKTLAIQKGVEAVPNTNDIIFLFDLHIDVPIGLLDSVRKVYFPPKKGLFTTTGYNTSQKPLRQCINRV